MTRVASICRYFVVLAGVLCIFLPGQALSQPAQDAPVVTKGAFVERYFLNKFTRPPAARRYAPPGAENLSPAERYQAVVKGLADKGVLILSGTKPDQPLSRIEFITLTYLLAGGRPTQSLGDQKALLKERGVIDPNDIGIVKSFQGDVNVIRQGKTEAIRITGAEPVLFKDIDETEFGARLELQFDDGSTLAIGEDTSVNIDEMLYDPKTKKRSIRLRMTVGTIMVNAAKNSHPDSTFEVITPTLVAGVRGTKFGTKVENSGKSAILTTEGSVVVCLQRPGEEENRLRRGGTTECELSDETGKEGSKSVLVNAGQVTGASLGDALLRVASASQEFIQTILDETRVVGNTQVARVSSAEAQKTEAIVQVEIRESAESALDSIRDTNRQTDSSAFDDKGENADLTNCLIGDNCPTIAAAAVPPPPTLEEQLAGLSGQALKDFFLGLTDQQQADLFGVLTTEQQAGLVSLLIQQEAQDLLNRFQPNSPFTDAVLKSLLDFGAVLSAAQVGQILDNLTVEQATEYASCDASVRNCAGEGDLAWFVDNPGLTDFGAEVATALARELDRLGRDAGGTIDGEQFLLATAAGDSLIQGGLDSLDTFPNVAETVMARLDTLDCVGSPEQCAQEIQDAFGGGFQPSAYTENGGYQAGQLRPTASGGEESGLIDVAAREGALNSNGFLAYAVQVEEDILNAAASVIRNHASNAFSAGALNAAVDTALALGSVRERDALFAQQADGRAGVVLNDSDGERLRVQQYVYRPPSNTDEVRMTSIALGASSGLNYLDTRVAFEAEGLAGLSASNIRDLPWNSYFSTFYSAVDCRTSPGVDCRLTVPNPRGSELQPLPLIDTMSMEMGNGAGDYIREGRKLRMTRYGDGSIFFPPDNFNFEGTRIPVGSGSREPFYHQHPTQLTLMVRKAGQAAETFTVGDGNALIRTDFRAGSVSESCPGCGGSIPQGEFRVIPDRFGEFPTNEGDPGGFNYVVNDGGTMRYFPMQFSVLGDATTAANAGRQTATCGASGTDNCGSLQIDTIWDAFRVNQPAGPQGLPTINIGANSLEIKAASVGGGEQVLSEAIRNVVIPWPRMIWRGESDF